MSSGEHAFQVAICGGGPVGLGLAIELGQRGIQTALVERYVQPQPIPKGQNLTQRTMEHMHSWGVEAELRAARTIPPAFGIGGVTAYGTLLGPYHYDWLQREIVRPFYFTDNERLPQYATEAVLRARVAQLPDVTTFFGWSVEDATDHGDRVSLAIVERAGDGRTEIEASYAVGCDGSRSKLRESAGITQTLEDHDRLMVLLVFRSQRLHEMLGRFPGKSFFNVLHPSLEGYWQFFGRVDLDGSFFFHAPVAPGTTRDNTDFRAMLQAAAGETFDVDFQHVGFWDLRFAMADCYAAGRIFIAGDAAHSHPPYGGYGINTGFEDARNLGWKLAAVLQGWGNQNLLASYDAERRPVFASTAHDFIERSINVDRDFLARFDPSRDVEAFKRAWAERSAGTKTEVGSFEPNYEGSPIVFGSGHPSAVGSHTLAARAGHHLAPQPSSAGDTVFDHFGSAFALLAFDADDAMVTAFETAAEARGIPLKVIRDTRQDGRKRYDSALILVRPDQFVAWTGDDAQDADAILIRAAGAQIAIE